MPIINSDTLCCDMIDTTDGGKAIYITNVLLDNNIYCRIAYKDT